MTLSFLAGIGPKLWLFAALPALALAALAAAIAFRGRAYLDLPQGFRGMTGKPDQPGGLAPGLAAALASAGAFGAAGLAGTGTALALGGAGAIAWVWVIALFLTPLRHAEAMLARTPGPGQRGLPGSLVGRLRTDDHRGVQAIGWVLAGVLALAAVLVFGGLHGAAATRAVDQLAPELASPAFWILALASVAVLAMPWSRGGAVIGGALALLGLAVAVVAACITIGASPNRAIGALGRAFSEVSAGAPSVDAFVGATAGEIATGALLGLGAPFGVATGVTGAAHGAADAALSRRQAAVAGATPWLAALVVTLLGMGVIGTGAFYEVLPDERPHRDLVAWKQPFTSPEERADVDRRHDGYMRVVGGASRDLDIKLGTERGMVRGQATWRDRGAPADLALQVHDGRPVTVLRRAPGTSSLERVPMAELDGLTVQGDMLPTGPGLLLAAAGKGSGAAAAKMLVIAFLVLALSAAIGWGLAVRQAFAGVGPPVVGLVAGCLPALGLALVAAGLADALFVIGVPVGAALAIVASLGIAVRARQAARA